MKYLLYLIIFFSSVLLSYEDSDLDGVEDSVDRCPNTPFNELVDINGCTIKSLFKENHYDIIIGVSYSDSDYQTLNQTDTFSTTLQADYYYKNISFGVSGSYFTTKGGGYDATGLNDFYINASYQLKPLEFLTLRVAIGVILPTYKTDLQNNNTDYVSSVNLSYDMDKITLFGGLSYTFIMDDNINDTNRTINIEYQNSIAISTGLGYYLTKNLYSSLSYNTSNSIYKDIENIQTLSLYAYYSIDKHLFSTLSYARGISDSASKNYLALRIGYYF